MSCTLHRSYSTATLHWSNNASYSSKMFLSPFKRFVPSSVSFTSKRHENVASARANMVVSHEPKQESLSARERRKQRNGRREQLKTEKLPWREEIENKLVNKKKTPKRHVLDMSHLAAKGLRWWIVFVPTRAEAEMAGIIAETYSTNFPGSEFEVFVPTVPSKRRMKDGSISNYKVLLHSGCVFLRTVMTRQICDVIKKVPRCRGFFGSKVGFLQQIVMPTPVPTEEMEGIFKKIKEEEEDLQTLKEQVRQEKKARHTSKTSTEENTIFNVGSTVRVASGPYINFEGHITSLPNENGKVQASIMTFGKLTMVELNLDEIEISQAKEFR